MTRGWIAPATLEPSACHGITVGNWWKLGKTGAYSILDQALVSLTSFFVSFTYARLLPRQEYGYFAITFSIFLFLAGFQNAIVLEPMSVLGPKSRAGNAMGYLKTTLVLNAWLTVPVALALVFVGYVYRFENLRIGDSIVGLGLATMAVSFYWFLRRACYFLLKPGIAAFGGACYGLSAVLLVFASRSWLSSMAPFAIVSGAASIASICILLVGYLRDHFAVVVPGLRPREVLAENWKYGRWITGVAFLYWLSSLVFSPMLGWWHTAASAALYKAAENFAIPLTHCFTALGLWLLPSFARRTSSFSATQYRQLAKQLTTTALAISAAFIALVASFGGRLAIWLYGSSYAACVPAIPLLCLGVGIRGVTDFGMGMVLRAAGVAAFQLWASLAAALLGITAGVALIRWYGVQGAAWAFLLSTCIQCLVTFWYFIRWTQDSAEVEHSSHEFMAANQESI
jgi:O-antigen/teichoic acid export membrane protein